MSIITRKGDQGTTSLMYNRVVPKCHPRVEACGAVDELNAALGVVRASASDNALREKLGSLQKHLVLLMGELATLTEDRPRYVKDGYGVLSPELTSELEVWARALERAEVSFQGWAMPGSSLTSANLDLARTICRRAERRVCALQAAGDLPNGEIVVYLNRLSDLLWLLARWEEQAPGTAADRPPLKKP